MTRIKLQARLPTDLTNRLCDRRYGRRVAPVGDLFGGPLNVNRLSLN